MGKSLEDEKNRALVNANGAGDVRTYHDDLRKTVQQEEREAELTAQEEKDMELLANLLEKRRKRASLTSREKDMEYIETIEKKINDVLDSITPEMLKKAKPKELAIVAAILIDKREILLGFDETRQKKSRGLKLQVMWKGEGSGGVQIQTEE